VANNKWTQFVSAIAIAAKSKRHTFLARLAAFQLCSGKGASFLEWIKKALEQIRLCRQTNQSRIH